jgi:hypothetical protein
MALEPIPNTLPIPALVNNILWPLNAITFAFRSNIIGPPSTFSSATFIMPNIVIPAGDFITINGITFTAKVNPSFGDLEADGVLTYADNAPRLLNFLQDDPLLKNEVNVEIVGLSPITFQVTSLNKGTGFNVTGSASPNFNLIITPATDENFSESKLNYAARFRLYLDTLLNSRTEIGNSTSGFGSDIIQVGGSLISNQTPQNVMEVDFADLIEPYLYTEFPEIMNSGTISNPQNFRIHPEMIQKFYIDFGEVYRDLGEPRGELKNIPVKLGDDGPSGGVNFYVVNSKLFNQLPKQNYPHNFKRWWVPSPQGVEFLTISPKKKITYIDSSEYLYFICVGLRSDRAIRLEYDIFYENGTGLQFAQPAIFGPIVGAAVSIEVGFRKIVELLGTNVENNSLIKEFNVRVIDNSNTPNRITVDKTYVMDNTERCNAYRKPVLLFQNPMGGVDTLRCNGEYSREVGVNRVNYGTTAKWGLRNFTNMNYREYYNGSNQATPNNSSVPRLIRNKAQLVNESNVINKVNTGLMPLDHLTWLQESLLNSPNVMLIEYLSTSGTGLGEARQGRMVNIKTSKIEVNYDDKLGSIDLEFENAIDLAVLP